MTAQLKPLKLAVAALLTLQTGCCLIPIPREAITRPETTLTISAEDGAPLEGALVRLTRLDEFPHYGQVRDEWDLMSDARGIVRVAHEAEYEWVMPLMMHGVGFRMWRVCVSHPDHITHHVALAHDHTLNEAGGVAPLSVKLVRGDTTPCPTRSSEPRLRQGEAMPGAPVQAQGKVSPPTTPD